MDDLVVDDLTAADLAGIAWAGPPPHIDAMETELERCRRGDAVYLAVRAPDGRPLAVGTADFTSRPGTGYLSQLITHPAVRSCGLGTRLVAALEGRIRARGLRAATLAVETGNPRARKLYERLGYVVVGQSHQSWTAVDVDHTPFTYACVCDEMRHDL